MSSNIRSDETEFVGSWIREGDSVIADPVARRIEDLITRHLIELSKGDDGWSVLYRDPSDQRMWELSYPNSDSHGGGAPHLKLIARSEAARKYRV